MIGEQISHFYIIRQLGSGGMGVVYEAQDTRLPRSVAIKFLKATLSSDEDALRRFKREARLASSLNHPNICTILDVEEADGQAFIAMELLHGRSLRSRLADEPLPLSEIIDIAGQVADALAVAHEQGIVHRDIAPGNVFITESGLVKLLDFGLAKHFSTADDGTETTDDLTATGAVAGTLHYIAPERLTDDVSADRRSDLYSLGILLYQMAAGTRPFETTPRNGLVTAIQSEPHVPLRQVAPERPVELERIIDKLLAKRPEDRYQSARALRTDLDALRSDHTVEGVRTSPPADGNATHPPFSWSRDPVRLALAAAAIVGVVSAVSMASRNADDSVVRFVERNLIDPTIEATVSITPDGHTLVYTSTAATGGLITLMPLDQRPKRTIVGTEGASTPIVAPDGRRLAFHGKRGIEVVPIDAENGGRAATHGWRYGNGAWTDDGAVVTAGRDWLLWKHNPGKQLPGDSLVALTLSDATDSDSKHLAPLVLPNAKGIVFTASRRTGPGSGVGRLAIMSADPGTSSPAPYVLLDIQARRAIAFVDGQLLYISADGKAIMAVRLDVQHRRVVGSPISVLDDEEGNLETAALADNGTLLYVRHPKANSVVLVDATGAVRQTFPSPDGRLMNPRLSPDGKRFAVQARTDSGEDVWLYDIASRTPTRFTTTGRSIQPTWTPDGRRIVFMRERRRGLIAQWVDGSAAPDSISGTNNAFAPIVAPDGKSVLFQAGPGVGRTIWSAPLNGASPPRRVIVDSIGVRMPALSHDGRWLAYVSDASGRDEVYARPVSGTGAGVQVSDSGGLEPAWSPDGRRIYYRSKGAFMTADVTTPGLAITARRRQFKDDFFDATMPHRNYDITADGKNFLLITTGSPEAVVVVNWLPKIRKRLSSEQ